MRTLSPGFLACAVYVLAPALAFGQPQAPPRPEGEKDQPPKAHELAHLLQQHISPSLEVDKEIAGLSASSHPEVLTWERVYALALARTRGGPGLRGEALDPKAIAEQATRNGVADFGGFRKEFLAARRRGGGGFHDPSGDFLALLDRLKRIDHARRNVAFHENVFTLCSELIKGETAGLSQLHLDQAEASLVLARQALAEEIADYRDRLEKFKVAMGLSVRAPVVLDRGIVASFGRVFDQARSWQERPEHSLSELPRIIKGLPALGEVVVEGRPILALMGGSTDQQEEALTLAARLAIQNRSDLDKGQAPGDAAAALELDIRRRIRRLFEMRRAYEAQQRSYELSIRLIDQGLEQIAAPSPGSAHCALGEGRHWHHRPPRAGGSAAERGGPARHDLDVLPDGAAGPLSGARHPPLRRLEVPLQRSLGPMRPRIRHNPQRRSLIRAFRQFGRSQPLTLRRRAGTRGDKSLPWSARTVGRGTMREAGMGEPEERFNRSEPCDGPACG